MRIVELQQGSDEWKAFRRERRNASESSVVMGLSPYMKPAKLARVKRGLEEVFVNSAMSRGTQFESEARAWYESHTGILGDPAVVEIEPYAASLDFWNKEESIVVDFKVPASETSDLWKMAVSGECPEHYAVQLQHQAALVDADKLQLCVYMPELRDGIILKVERSAKRWDEIQQAWDEFWSFYMAGDLPEEDHERCDPDWFDAAERYRVAKMESDRAQSKMDEAKADLIELAGEQTTKGCGLQLIRSERSGSVAWSKLAKELSVSDELIKKYTGKGSTVYTVKID